MSYYVYFPHEESDMSNVNEQRDTSSKVLRDQAIR